MNNKTKILIGIGLAGIAYLIWKNKSKTSTASVHLPVEKIDEQIKKELPKETPATPSTPVNPATPSTPVVTPTPSSPETPVAIPDFDFEQYFKDHPIVFDIDPNIGSSLVNTNLPKQQKCMTTAEWLKRKEEGTLPPINSYCVEGDGLIITDKERLQNAFQMKDIRNELSRDAFGNLDNFMERGTDFSYLEENFGYSKGGGNEGGVFNKFTCDPFGFGGIPSC